MGVVLENKTCSKCWVVGLSVFVGDLRGAACYEHVAALERVGHCKGSWGFLDGGRVGEVITCHELRGGMGRMVL